MSNAKNAIEVIKQIHVVLEGVRAAADNYAEVLDPAGIKPVPGKLYKTYDGSTVLVVRPYRQCNCENCVAGRMSFGLSFLQTLTGRTPANPSEQEQHQDENAEDQFVCVVVKGGHGIQGVGGEEPGDNYVVDSRGLTLFEKTQAEDKPVIQQDVRLSYLAVVGLSLKRELAVQIDFNS